MSRLINIEDVSLIKSVTAGGLSAKALWRRINNQPTVEAVPVDFIEKEAEKMRMSENPAMRMNSIILSALVRNWREQQNETV